MNRRELLTGLAPAPPPTERKWAEIPPRESIRKRYFPNVPLLTHQGKRVLFYDDLVKDKMVVLNFMYATCTGVCPGVMWNLSRVRKLLGDRVGRDIFLYSFTLKPEEDTPEALADYARKHGVQPGWSLLTGKPDDVELLRHTLGFYDSNPELDRDKSNHSGNIRYGNEPLMRWAACPGMSDPEWIVKSILWLDWPQGESPWSRNAG
jgi:protein SCO1/2